MTRGGVAASPGQTAGTFADPERSGLALPSERPRCDQPRVGAFRRLEACKRTPAELDFGWTLRATIGFIVITEQVSTIGDVAIGIENVCGVVAHGRGRGAGFRH